MCATGRLDSAPVADSLVIPARFNGPPDSGHGGYSAGLAAGLVEGPAEVSLRAPPPLDTPMPVERDAGSVRVVHEGNLVLEARPAAVDVDVPEPVSAESAAAAEPRSPFLEDSHPFPSCFACGPRRAEGDGLRLFAAPIEGRDVFAAAWTPASEFGSEGSVEPLFIWAALDCPSCAPALADAEAPIVLASLAAELRAPVAVGEPHVVGSWRIEREGRKRWNGVALWDSSGTVCAAGRALWIELKQSK
jgi:hypothetical protein